jgi:hypothetical protein
MAVESLIEPGRDASEVSARRPCGSGQHATGSLRRQANLFWTIIYTHEDKTRSARFYSIGESSCTEPSGKPDAAGISNFPRANSRAAAQVSLFVQRGQIRVFKRLLASKVTNAF